MIGDVEKALRDIVGSATTLIDAAGPGRLFELYLMTGIALALKQRSYEAWIRRSDGSRVAPNDAQREFVQRGGVPAGIPPASAGPGEACSIVFSRHGPEWEMLNGVTFEGRSQALHEIEGEKEARKAGRSAGRCQKTPSGVIQAIQFCGTNCGTTFITHCFI